MTLDCSANVGVGCCFQENYDTMTVAAHIKEVFWSAKSERKMSQSILPGRQNVASGCPN